jgi:hypothetical protein
LDTTSSSVEIGSRWLTPDRLSTFRSDRAWIATSSTTSRTNCGMSTFSPPGRAVHASCAVIWIAFSRETG